MFIFKLTNQQNAYSVLLYAQRGHLTLIYLNSSIPKTGFVDALCNSAEYMPGLPKRLSFATVKVCRAENILQLLQPKITCRSVKMGWIKICA